MAMTMAAPRVYYAMAKDGAFFSVFGRLHPRFGTPANAILLQTCGALLILLFGAFDKILAACKAAGLKVGVHCASIAYGQKMIDRGFDLITGGIDVRYMSAGRREAAEMRAWLDRR